ncbi:hypothetical protein ABH307_01825 [Acinetobacter pittii]|uniref:hypothetical protein n=1 Tax=Acinetobacter pittii TaxID=48296 RepID=UPI0032611EAF
MRIFVSYTLRDSILTLQDFEIIVDKLSDHKVFIHFLNPHIDSHKKIKDMILESDLLLLIKTDEVFESKWVLDELSIANKANIPLFFIDVNDIRNEVR